MPGIMPMPQGRPMGVKQLSTTYNPGSVTTATEGAPVAAANPQLGNVLGTLLANKLAAIQAAREPQPAQMDAAPMRAMAMDRLGPAGPGQASPRAQVETPWYSYQGAATRPVGLSPGMVPGMAADPNLLPPWMRPQQAGVSYGPSTITRAGADAGNQAAFDAKLGADRARTANGNFEF